MQNSYLSTGHLFTHKMNIHLDVFGALMLNRVAKKVNHTHIITIDQSSVVIGQCSSNNKFLIQQDSETTLATPWYSASSLDRKVWVGAWQTRRLDYLQRRHSSQKWIFWCLNNQPNLYQCKTLVCRQKRDTNEGRNQECREYTE